MKTKRKVYVAPVRDSFFVLYLNREKRQRYKAAEFHRSMRTYKQVCDWVRDQPHLELIEL